MTERIAYVTGGMGGIGTAICQRLHKEGHRVIAGCGPSRDHEKWLAEQKALGFVFHVSVGNVADWDSTAAAFEKAKAEHGPIDILVNNAGITRDGVFRKMTKADWDAVIDANLNSLFNVTKQVIEDMVQRGWGRIINISSVNGQKGQFGQVNYSTAKAGIHERRLQPRDQPVPPARIADVEIGDRRECGQPMSACTDGKQVRRVRRRRATRQDRQERRAGLQTGYDRQRKRRQQESATQAIGRRHGLNCTRKAPADRTCVPYASAAEMESCRNFADPARVRFGSINRGVHA